jgi:vacuolar-type H+-ATPase subunit H
MRRISYALFAAAICIGLALAACSPKKAATSEEAITIAGAMETTEEKVDYLIFQAKAFFESEQYKDAAASARHVLKKLDADSEEARKIFEEARKKTGTAFENILSDVKDTISDIGK